MVVDNDRRRGRFHDRRFNDLHFYRLGFDQRRHSRDRCRLLEPPSGDLRRQRPTGVAGAPAGEGNRRSTERDAHLTAVADHRVAARTVEIDDEAHRVRAVLREAQVAHRAAGLAVVVGADGQVRAAKVDDDT